MAFPTTTLLAVTAAVAHSRWVAPKVQLGPESEHACVLTHVGEVKCWGRNDHGQLGIGSNIDAIGGAEDFDGNSLQPVDLGDDRYAVAIATGESHTCAVLDNGKAKCWGYNQYGSLGYGDTIERGKWEGHMGNSLPYIDLGADSSVVNIWAGGLHTCALLESHEVKCWGYNDEGQIGERPSTGMWYARGTEPEDMGANLNSVDLGVGPDGAFVGDMALGSYHTCALFTDGAVKCWGMNRFGALGYGDTKTRGLDADTMGTALPPIDLGSGRTAVQISAGAMHTCALLDNQAVTCWGNDGAGRTGRGGCGSSNCGDGPYEMGDNITSVDFGTSSKPVEIKSGAHHNCAVLDDASVKCWGRNDDGSLGYGDTKDRGKSGSSMGETNWPKVDLGPNSQVLHVGCSDRTCVVLGGGEVKCFGDNNKGILGIGSDEFENWGAEPGQMGSDLPTVLTMVVTSTTTATETLTTTVTDTATNTTTTVQAAALISSTRSPGGSLLTPFVIVALRCLGSALARGK